MRLYEIHTLHRPLMGQAGMGRSERVHVRVERVVIEMDRPTVVTDQNEVIDRLFALNEATESADAFCAYLKELNARDVLVKRFLVRPSDVGAPHCLSIRWVHAESPGGGTITACLDPEGSRPGNRASVGQIINCSKTRRLLTSRVRLTGMRFDFRMALCSIAIGMIAPPSR